MTGCECPHPPESHAPLKGFNTAMCLEPDCDCDGPAVANVERALASHGFRTMRFEDLERLVDMFSRILTTPREPEDQARQLVQALMFNFDVMAKR